MLYILKTLNTPVLDRSNFSKDMYSGGKRGFSDILMGETDTEN